MKINMTAMCMCMAAAALFAACVCSPAAGYDHVDKAGFYYAHSRFDEAIAELTKAVERDVHDASAYFLRAKAYYNKGDFARAIADLDAGLSAMPDSVQAYYNRAVVHFSMQEYSRAWEDVSRAAARGYPLDPVFFEQLKEDSGRER